MQERERRWKEQGEEVKKLRGDNKAMTDKIKQIMNKEIQETILLKKKQQKTKEQLEKERRERERKQAEVQKEVESYKAKIDQF